MERRDWLPDAVAGLGTHRRYALPDGRTLSYATFGDPAGRPVLCCHGTPGSRWFGALFEGVARDLGVRVVTVERPGVGWSSPYPDRTIGNWCEDIRALADRRGWNRLPVVGFSGGAPYALDCAVGLPSLVPGVSLVAPTPPPEGPSGPLVPRIAGRTALHASWLLERVFSSFAARSATDDPSEVAGLLTDEGVLDVVVGGDATAAEVLKADLLGAVERTADGVVREFALGERPWGFDLADVSVPVECWHGTDDENVPVAAGRYIADHLPDSTYHERECEDHGSVLVCHRRAILASVL